MLVANAAWLMFSPLLAISLGGRQWQSFRCGELFFIHIIRPGFGVEMQQIRVSMTSLCAQACRMSAAYGLFGFL
jgi:hypothetical protein